MSRKGARVGQPAGMVALLFTDLVGSTELLDRLGDDAAEELRRTHFSLLRQAVAEAGGTEVKSLGDGLMVSFTSSVKAVGCAVAMQRAIAEHNRAGPGPALQVRVGLHAGEPLPDEDDLFGTAVVVAKRLCDQAKGGQILTSELVAGLVGSRGGFRFRPIGRLSLKGLAQPLPAALVDWEPAQPPPPPPRPAEAVRRPQPAATGVTKPGGVPTQASLLIGRQRELSRLEEALSEAAQGRGQVVFVVGDMGLGKTRLAEEALALARQQHFLVLVGRTPAAGSGLAYAPVLNAFGSVLRALEPWQRDPLVGDLPHLGRLWPELGLPPPAPLGDPDLERTLLFEAVARLLERLAAGAPLALFVDDLHWADAPSLALLGYLTPGVAALPVLVVGAYRPEGATESKGLRQFVTNALRSGLAVEVPLQRLDRDEVTALVAGILGDAPPASLLELSARAAGTPLFVEALIRGLLDAGALVRSEGSWVLAGDQPKALPRGVRDLVVDRLDLLAPDERSTVELIAHGTQGLPHDLLEGAGGLESDQLLAVLGHLVGAGLVVQEEDGAEITYRLSHPLIQEVAAAELPAIAGRRLHALIARTIERLRPSDLDRLAFHYSRAAGEVDADRALDALLEAGERALSLSAHDEAARHFGLALHLIRDGRRPELLAYVLERLGESWEPVGETAAAIEVWTEAVGERERAGDALGMARLRRRLGLAARNLGEVDSARRHLAAGVEALRELPPSEELVDLHHARLLVDSPLFDPDRAADTVAELSRLAQVLGSPRSMIESLSGEGTLHLGQGDYDLARAKAEEALRIAEQTGDWNLLQRAHRDLAWVTYFVADHETCRSHAQAQLELDRRLAPAQEPLSRMQFALLDLQSGPWDRVVEQLEEAIAQARRHDQPRIMTMALGTLALAHTLRGELDRGEECLAEARRAGRITGGDRALHLIWLPEATLAFERGDATAVLAAAAPLRLPAARVLVGAAQVLDGDLEGALATAEDLAAKGPPSSYPVALADRVFGLVEKARGNTDAAREHLERSAAALAALRLPFEAAVSQLHLGTEESARQALTTFESLEAARYVGRARQVLRGLGIRPPSPRRRREHEQPLSPRELDVARLVAEGLTNAEIAERLVLSVRTVESHLDHIFSRLGISSRTALARWMATSEQRARAR